MELSISSDNAVTRQIQNGGWNSSENEFGPFAFLFFFSLLFTDFILNFYFILSFNYEKIMFIVTRSIQLKNVWYN